MPSSQEESLGRLLTSNSERNWSPAHLRPILELSVLQVTVICSSPSDSTSIPLLAVCFTGKMMTGSQAKGHLTVPLLPSCLACPGVPAASILGTGLDLVYKADWLPLL